MVPEIVLSTPKARATSQALGKTKSQSRLSSLFRGLFPSHLNPAQQLRQSLRDVGDQRYLAALHPRPPCQWSIFPVELRVPLGHCPPEPMSSACAHPYSLSNAVLAWALAERQHRLAPCLTLKRRRIGKRVTWTGWHALPPVAVSPCVPRNGSHKKKSGHVRSGTFPHVLFWHGVINYICTPMPFHTLPILLCQWRAHAQACTGSFLLCTALSLKSIIRHGQHPLPTL